jgi:spermidine/putrescine transport system substrate-binding protein
MKHLLPIVAGALFLFSCGPQKETINLYNWTYYIPFEVLKSFEKEYGIRVNLDSYDSNEMMYAKIASGNTGYDITVPSSDYAALMIRQGMLQELDHALLPNLVNVDPAILLQMQSYDTGNRYTVPYFEGATGIHVNTNFVKEYDESWSIFNRTDLKNRMTLMNDPREVLGGALKMLGYSANSTSPAEINEAKNLVIQWKQNILKFDAESFGKDFANGNVYVAHGYAEVVLKELEGFTETSHRFFIPKEGSVLYLDNLVILKSSQKREAAHQFINYLLTPQIHAAIADTFFYPTVIPAAEEYRTIAPPYTLQDAIAKGSELRLDVGKAINYYNSAWNEIMSGF